MRSLVLFVRALYLIVAARALLNRRGTTATLRRLAKPRNGPHIDPLAALDAIRRGARLAGVECLPQAVALTALLERHGHDPSLVLGCRRETDGRWTAHAWVEADLFRLEPVRTAEQTTLASLTAEQGWVPAAYGN